jgi:xanthine dehydrogenase accessory factor
MRDLLSDYQTLHAGGAAVGRAVVTSVWGSAPRPEGACLLATAEGRIAGSISGGCIESAAAQEIAAAITRGTPGLVTYGVSHEKAWEVGLACGGIIKVFVEPTVRPVILAAARGEGGVIVATVVDGGAAAGRLGGSATIHDDGAIDALPAERWIGERTRDAALAALRRESSGTVEVPSPDGAIVTVFLEVFPRRPKLVVFGGVHIAMALVPMARSLGYRTTVADGRVAFLNRERFPDADELLVAWPEEAFRKIGLDAATYVCVLSHDPKFDEPALEIALRSAAPYIGAIGSRKTQAARRARLLGQGFTEADLSRLRGPVGLDLGGRSPAETALGIMAEMTMVRYGGSGRSLGSAS